MRAMSYTRTGPAEDVLELEQRPIPEPAEGEVRVAVGYYAIQMARLAGAERVITPVSSGEKAAAAREAGADVVLDYRREDIVARVAELTGGRGVDRIIEVELSGNSATWYWRSAANSSAPAQDASPQGYPPAPRRRRGRRLGGVRYNFSTAGPVWISRRCPSPGRDRPD